MLTHSSNVLALSNDQARPHLRVFPCTNAVSRIFVVSFISLKHFFAIFKVAFTPTMVVNHRTRMLLFVFRKSVTRRDSRIIRRTKLDSPPRQLFSIRVPPKFVLGFWEESDMLLKNGGLHTVKSICSSSKRSRSRMGSSSISSSCSRLSFWSSVRTFIVTLVLLFETSRMLILLLLLLLLLLQLSPSTCPVVSSQEHSDAPAAEQFLRALSTASFVISVPNMSHFGCLEVNNKANIADAPVPTSTPRMLSSSKRTPSFSNKLSTHSQ